jgi:hypothetical protein
MAINGRGAFRRLKDELARWPGELERWQALSDERQRGRARSRHPSDLLSASRAA